MIKANVASMALCGLLLLSSPGSRAAAAAAKTSKRDNCTGNSDPDCLPYYNDYKRNATFDDLSPNTTISAYKGLHYTGFTVTGEPNTTNPHIIPASSPNCVRAPAFNATAASNSNNGNAAPRISSNGAIFKFKALSYACTAPRSSTPAPCSLNISGFNPGPGGESGGGPPQYRNSVMLRYDADSVGSTGGGTAEMATATYEDGAGLGALDLANYYTFEAVGDNGVPRRLLLDGVDVVYYKPF